VADTPLAGGEIEPWELDAFRHNDVESRLSLNRFYLTAQGRRLLLRHLENQSYRLSHPEEAALMVFACRPQEKALPRTLEPFLENVRFYPQTLSVGNQDPPFGEVCRYTCSEALNALKNYRLPLEVLRERESLLLWRPFQEQMLQRLWETCEEGWPFQHYPNGWNQKANDLIARVEEALKEEVVCCFPQRSDSDFRRLFSTLETAAVAPQSLNGKEVAFCKNLLDDSLKKWGSFEQSPRRPKARELPGQNTLDTLSELETRLADLPSERGLEASSDLVFSLPKALRKRVLRSRAGTLQQLCGWGVIPSVEVIGRLAPQLVSGVFAGDQSALVGRCYRVFSSRSRPLVFEELPWIKPLWSTPASETLRSAARQLLECWWTNFPQHTLSFGLRTQLSDLCRWMGLREYDDFQESLLVLARATRAQIDTDRAIRLCQTYREQQRALPCPKPYQRQRRDRRIQDSECQEALLRALVTSRKGP
jgi:hypothetical protein